MIFCNSPSQIGELHARLMSPRGRAMPWFLREDEAVESWEGDLSVPWRNLEVNIEDMEDYFLLKTQHCVAKTTSKRPKMAGKDATVRGYVPVPQLSLSQGGILDAILKWKSTALDKYVELGFILSRANDGLLWLPEMVYTSQVPCSCPMGHEWYWGWDDLLIGTLKELAKNDFEAAIAGVERLWAFEMPEQRRIFGSVSLIEGRIHSLHVQSCCCIKLWERIGEEQIFVMNATRKWIWYYSDRLFEINVISILSDPVAPFPP